MRREKEEEEEEEAALSDQRFTRPNVNFVAPTGAGARAITARRSRRKPGAGADSLALVRVCAPPVGSNPKQTRSAERSAAPNERTRELDA